MILVQVFDKWYLILYSHYDFDEYDCDHNHDKNNDDDEKNESSESGSKTSRKEIHFIAPSLHPADVYMQCEGDFHFRFNIFTSVQKLKFSHSGRGSNSRSIDWEMAGQNEGDAKIDFPVNRRREELGWEALSPQSSAIFYHCRDRWVAVQPEKIKTR